MIGFLEKKIKYFLFAILFICPPTYGWRIENNLLIIEKGDNLWQISHSIFGGGVDFQKLWALRIDKERFLNPNLIYDGMKFNLPFSIEKTLEHPVPLPKSTTDTALTLKIDTVIQKFSFSNNKLEKIEKNTRFSWTELIFEKFFLALGIACIIAIVTEYLKKYFNMPTKRGKKSGRKVKNAQ